MQATELLLQERVPREAIVSEPRPARRRAGEDRLPSDQRAAVSNATYRQRAHALLVERSLHGGYHARRRRFQHVSRLAVTRQREDRTTDAGAHFIYLRDPWSGDVWSATHLPTCREPYEFTTTFELDKCTFRRRDGDFEIQLQIVVSPEDDLEVRRLSITNHGSRPRELEVTSYAEIVLSRPEDDLAHPAFGKLFIETDTTPSTRGCCSADGPAPPRRSVSGISRARRRGRLGGAVEWETDCAQFIAAAERRRIRLRSMAGLCLDHGAVLDPIRGAPRSRPPGAWRFCARDIRHGHGSRP